MEADIYSAGVTFFAIMTGVLPYKDTKVDDRLYKLLKDRKFDKYWKNIKRVVPQGEKVIAP